LPEKNNRFNPASLVTGHSSPENLSTKFQKSCSNGLSTDLCIGIWNFFFSLYIFGEPAVHFSKFSPLSPLTEVSPQPSAIPGVNPLEDWQSAVGWGNAGTAGQQSGARATTEPPCLPWNLS
jgi:hypothetical protein